MAFSNIIGENTAKSIAQLIAVYAKQTEVQDQFLNIITFAESGREFLTTSVIECIEELKSVNRSFVPIAYEDKTKLRDYFYQFLPTPSQMLVIAHYGADRINQLINQNYKIAAR